MAPHDFKAFPEITNNKMQFYYFDSPHKQMIEDFTAKCIRVKDGDTIQVTIDERDFDFPIRLTEIAAPELDERGGPESQAWLESQILGKDVDIIISETRVEKWGRLLAEIIFSGMSMNQLSMMNGQSVRFDQRTRGINI